MALINRKGPHCSHRKRRKRVFRKNEASWSWSYGKKR